MITGGSFTWFSRESLLLANNVILHGRARLRCCWAPVPAVHRCAGHGQDLGRPALLQRGVRAADGAGPVPDGVGPLVRWKGASLPDIVTR
jgi:cytochrome c-type biogenesis protein CcmF